MSYEINRIKDNYLHAPLPLWFLYLYFIKRSWLHCNPSNTLINNQEVLQHYFFGNEEIIFKNKDNNEKYCIDKFDNIKNMFFDTKFKLVFVYGNKGYGKTTIQNYLLMKYTKDLNQEGLTWLRIDVSKIYREWEGFRGIDLLSYLYIQIVYVYIRYYKITSHNNHDVIFANQFETIKSKLEEKGIYETFVNFEKELTSSQNDISHLKMNKKAYLSQKMSETKKIAEILLECLSSSIVFFIDGIDNLDYQNNYRKDFAEQIKNVLTLANETFSLQKFKSVIIALRQENERFFYDILKASEQNHYVHGHLRIEQYEIENISFPKITNNIQTNFQTPHLFESEHIKQLILKSLRELASVNSLQIEENFTDTSKNTPTDETIEKYINKQISALEECNEKNIKKESTNIELSLNYAAIVFDIERKIGLTINDIANIVHYLLDFDNKIFYFLEKYEEYIKKSLHTKGLSKEIENINIVGELFQNNYRETLSHAINSYLYIQRFMQRKGNNANNIDTYLNSNTKYLLVMEALFKNGNLYGITNQDFRYMAYFKNIAFINLFNLELTRLNTQPPIEVILVLSYMKDSNQSFSYQTLASDLAIQENDIIKILEKFEEFGYVKFDLDRKLYKISKKGEIILEYSFRDINILNTYCYGGKFYTGESTKIKTYGNKWENYITAMIFNVTFVINYLEKELEQYEKVAERYKTNNLQSTIKNLRKRIHNKFLQDDVRLFHNKLNDENKEKLHKDLQQESIDKLFLQILQTQRHIDIRKMSHYDFIQLGKLLDNELPKNKDEKINYRIAFVKHFYAKDSEQILDTTQLHKYIFEDLADIFEDATEYKKRKQLCNLTDIKLTMLDEISDYLDKIKQKEHTKEN